MSEYLPHIAGIITTVFTTWFAFLIGRRKTNAEAQKAEYEAKRSELENVEKAVEIWRETAEQLTQRYVADYQNLYNQNVELIEQNKKLIETNRHLEKELEKIKSELKKLKVS